MGAAPRGGLLGHLRKLFAHSAIYGAADVFTNVVNLLLVPLYTAYLGPREYGHIALLALFATAAKIVFRLGLDAGFFRIHYELERPEERRRLAGSVTLFTVAAGAALFLALLLLRGPASLLLLGDDVPSTWWVVLAAADVWVGTLAFVPLALLRIEDRPGLFSALSSLRHAVNIALKVVLVVRGHGVTGILWSDLLATAVFVLALLPLLRGRAEWVVERPLLRQALAFGLPKVPHGILVQVLNLADRKVLDAFATRAEVGLYQMGYTLGSGVKFATSAFEPAWSPFVYARVRDPDGPRTLARVATVAFAAFLAAALALAVLGGDLLALLTPRNPAFRAAAPVIPVVALAYALHGLFLLTSIGIGVAKEARYYPLVTAAAAAVNVSANLALVPRAGMMGAAWATVLGYAVMAAFGYVLSRRAFPIPYEGGRLAALAAAALLAWLAASVLGVHGDMPVRVGALLLYPALAFAILGRRKITPDS